MRSYQQLFAELKRRHVFKVAAIYGAAAFAIIQVSDVVLPRLGLPDWTVTFMVALLILVFPIALICAWAFEMTPAGIQRTEAASPGEIEAIVAEPASKRWPVGLLAVLGVALLVASTWWVARRSAPDAGTSGTAGAATEATVPLAGTEDERPSLAVLPFADMSPEGDQEYFGDGMADEIMNTFVKIRGLRVAGRTSAFAYKGQNKDLREIGTELGVGYLVEGSVRKERDELRITAQLIDASDGSQLWSDSYDRSLASVFDIQREIAESIAEELRVPLGLGTGRDELVTPTGDLEAYDLYLAGRSRLRERGPSLVEAVRLFEAAIARDSAWAPAWAGLAEAWELRSWYSSARPDSLGRVEFSEIAYDESERAARRALELDPDNPSALVALGSVQRNRADWEAAETTYRKAIDSDPDNAEAHQQYGDLLLNVGRVAEAVRTLDRAAMLDPAPVRLNFLAFGLSADSREDEAIEMSELAVARSTTPAGRRYYGDLLGLRLAWQGQIDRALEAWESSRSDDPVGWNRSAVAAFLRAPGDHSGFPPEVSAFIESADDSGYMHTLFSYVGGPPERAIGARLEHAAQQPLGRLIEMRLPWLDGYRSDPRIEAHFAEAGLAGSQTQRTPVRERTRPLVLQQADAAGDGE